MNECIVCGNTENKPLYRGTLKCETCGHVFLDLSSKGKDFFEIYRKNYFSGGEYSNYIADKEVLQKNFRLRLKVLQKFLEPQRHQHLFEIGSAYGFFLDIVKDRFKTILGIDITEAGATYARKELNLDVIEGDLLTHELGNQKFDVVCMWDTLEHLRNPDLYLEKISRHMEPGALLAITTGDIESLVARIKKGKWRLLHHPSHAHFFSKQTITKLLEKYRFEVIFNRYCGFYRSIDNIAYNILVLRKKKQWLYNFLRKIGLTQFNFYLNLYDIMYVIARKR